MIQRISVRIKVIKDDRVLMIRRADGRQSILGRYELPGGRVLDSEQPDDAAKRILGDDLGLKNVGRLELNDALTYTDADDRDIQYAVIVYRIVAPNSKRAIRLSSHYNKYVWYSIGKLDHSAMTEVSKLVLGAMSPILSEPIKASESDSSDKYEAIVYTDGGSRGNPGPSAAGYVVIKKGEIIDQGGEFIGITTNNQAEYHGVIIGLESAKRLGLKSVEMRIDSMLVVNQLKGIYKIKNRELWPVNERVRELVEGFESVKFSYVPREMNQLADGMVNRTLDDQGV